MASCFVRKKILLLNFLHILNIKCSPFLKIVYCVSGFPRSRCICSFRLQWARFNLIWIDGSIISAAILYLLQLCFRSLVELSLEDKFGNGFASSDNSSFFSAGCLPGKATANQRRVSEVAYQKSSLNFNVAENVNRC